MNSVSKSVKTYVDVGHGVTLAHMLAPGGGPRLDWEGILQGVLGEAVSAGVSLGLVPRGLDKIHTVLFGTFEEKSVMRLLMVVLDKVRVHLFLMLLLLTGRRALGSQTANR
jgi:hypothetical protein